MRGAPAVTHFFSFFIFTPRSLPSRAVAPPGLSRFWVADVLKQQGHFHDLNTLAYSTDGSLIATGGDDGKVRPADGWDQQQS